MNSVGKPAECISRQAPSPILAAPQKREMRQTISKAFVVLLLFGAPAALVFVALLYGLHAIGWPQWLAVLALVHAIPARSAVLSLAVWVSTVGAVVLVIYGLLH